jgi:Bacteroidetes-specific putative membrane protein
MREMLIFCLWILCWINAFTQSYIRVSNFWENPYTLNPAAINNRDLAEFSLVGRKQWVNVDGAPSTCLATATTYIDRFHTQLGLKVIDDKIGFTSDSHYYLSYGYDVKLNEEWHMGFGLTGSYDRFSYDLSKLSLDESADPEAYQSLLDEKHFNADLGLEFKSNSYRIGAVSQRLFSGINSAYQPRTNILYLKYRNFRPDPVNWGFGVAGFQYAKLYQMEFSLQSYFSAFRLTEQSDQFHIGAFYRTPGEVGAIFGLNLKKSLYMSYSYDWNNSAIGYRSRGTHELMLIYRIPNDKGCNCH